MTPRPTRLPEPRRERATTAQLADLRERIDAAEQRHQRLRNTVAALGREVGVSLGCSCSHCDECYLLVADGRMYCPRCGHLESV